jgi:hypothetical protein
MKRYRYYFIDIDKPIMIEATNKISARSKLEDICNNPAYAERGYKIMNIRLETTETLVVGVSEKTINNQNYIWNGHTWINKS